ncbi:MAG: hypothetical protein ABIK79_10680 [Chloroflexota bacterium]
MASNGSPRKPGHMVEVLETAQRAANERGARTELLHLANYDIRRCRAAMPALKSLSAAR